MTRISTVSFKTLGRFPLLGAALSLALFGVLGATNASAGSFPLLCGSPNWTANPAGNTINPSGSGIVTNWDANDVGLNLGDVFTAVESEPVCALGIYGGNNASYLGSETVSLYDSTGALLTSTTVTDTDPLIDGYYWAPTSQVTLTPGDVYTVVDQLNSNGWGYGSVTNDEAIFNYNDYGYNATSPTAYSLNGSGPAYLGGNVMYLTPEPDTLLLLGSGLLGLAGFARSKFGKKTS